MKILTLRSLCLSAALTLTSIATMAQEIPIVHVNVPDVTRLVEINTEGVNLRRLPNTTSGKVMMWNSDAGSYYTYTKLFYSDTEASRYRANRSTGAYVNAYHPQKGELLMVSPKQNAPKNGWYQVLAFAEGYAGNSGKPNSRLGWVKGDFCKVIDVAESTEEQLLALQIPITFPDPNDPEGGKVLDAYIQRGSTKSLRTRPRGQFNHFEFVVFCSSIDAIKIVYPYIEGNFMYIAETLIPIEYDPNLTKDFKVEKCVEEYDMGDDDYEYTKITLKGNRNKKSFMEVFFALDHMKDESFSLIVNQIVPNGEMPTDCVYFRGTDGKTYKFGYNSDLISSIGYTPCTIPLQTAQ